MKCICCGLPVDTPSMGGFNICPTCDCGYKRNDKCPDYAKWPPVPDLTDRNKRYG